MRGGRLPSLPSRMVRRGWQGRRPAEDDEGRRAGRAGAGLGPPVHGASGPGVLGGPAPASQGGLVSRLQSQSASAPFPRPPRVLGREGRRRRWSALSLAASGTRGVASRRRPPTPAGAAGRWMAADPRRRRREGAKMGGRLRAASLGRVPLAPFHPPQLEWNEPLPAPEPLTQRERDEGPQRGAGGRGPHRGRA